MLWMHKTTDECLDQKWLAILVLKALFWMQKTIGEVGPIETSNSGPKVAVVHAKGTNEGLVP